MLPATMACDSLLPPVKFEILTSSPCFLKRPSLSATFTGRMGDALASALPTLSGAPAHAADPTMADWNAITMASTMLRERTFVICFLRSLARSSRRARRLSVRGRKAAS